MSGPRLTALGDRIYGETPEDGLVARVYGDDALALKMAASPTLLEALEDMLSGWRYIREVHGDLGGVGWDRAQQAAEAAIKQARGREGADG